MNYLRYKQLQSLIVSCAMGISVSLKVILKSVLVDSAFIYKIYLNCIII